MKRPFPLYMLLFLHVVLAAGALYGGWKLLTDPIGFGMRPEWLDHSPFHSYTGPGIVLLLLLGIFPLIVARGRADAVRSLAEMPPDPLPAGLTVQIVRDDQ